MIPPGKLSADTTEFGCGSMSTPTTLNWITYLWRHTEDWQNRHR